MTPAINRTSVLTHIAFTQAQSGHVKGVIETMTHIDAPLRRKAALLGIAIIRARHGDLPGALVAADTIEGERSRAAAYQEIEAWQRQQGPLAASASLDRYPHAPIDTFSALHGMANGCLNNGGGVSMRHTNRSTYGEPERRQSAMEMTRECSR